MKIGKRELNFSNLQKPLYPDGFTKGEVLEYYIHIAPIMLPYLKGRAMTLKRYPNGTSAPFFFEKNCPAHRPAWVPTAEITGRKSDPVNYCMINEMAALLWVANLASIELHAPLALANKPDRPTVMVFDLDPGPSATLLDCLKLGVRMRDYLADLGLQSFPKTSGGKGLHFYVPLNTAATFEQTKTFARAVADEMVRQDPARVVSSMSKALRNGKVFIDWSQNDQHKTTVSAYSLRAGSAPWVSTPITWEEVERALKSKSPGPLKFSPAEVIERIESIGDVFEPVLTTKQKLPSLTAT